MGPIRNIAAEVGGGNVIQKQSLQAIQGLWNEWEIHCLILVSFGLQVFLFFTAGMRRHSVSWVLNSLIWLAYLSADSVAIFVLGHLAVHASGSHHLIIFWAPFLLLHLGGQDTITAFSLQDNELWQRHLLGLVTQASVAGYIISISSWQDNRLLAATVLMFFSGVFKYIGRILCLYQSRPKFLRNISIYSLDKHAHGTFYVPGITVRDSFEERLRCKVDNMISNDMKLPPFIGSDIVLDTPLNNVATVEGSSSVPYFLNMLKSSTNRLGAYVYVSKVLVRSYERIYTKASIYFVWIRAFKAIMSQDYEHKIDAIVLLHISSFLLLFPLISSLVTLKLFMDAEKSQLYTHDDVTISYILLIGATILDVASVFMYILSYFASSEAPTSCPLTPVAWCLASYIHPAGRHRKHWSKMLAQYNIFECYFKGKFRSIMSIVSQQISENYSRIAVSKDLEELVLDKLLDLGTGEQKDWDFASFRGQRALHRWAALCATIDNADLATSVMIWHIATEICYFEENRNFSPDQTKKIRMSRELANYIMYLVFTCGVMVTASSQVVHNKTHREIKKILGGAFVLRDKKEAIRLVFQANSEGQQRADTDSSSQPVTQVQLLKNNIKALTSPVLPRACTVVGELMNGVPADGRWDLIAEVWLEMLFYIAPRCGGAFHAKHLSTGGEFVSHVLLLMQLLGPFLPPPNAHHQDIKLQDIVVD